MGFSKKIAKRIKKDALKSFEKDLRNSVLDELYKTTPKEDIESLKEEILLELQKEIFETSDESDNSGDDSEAPKSMLEEKIREAMDAPIEDVDELEDGRYTYKGFVFDVDKMKSLATGKKPKETPHAGVEREKKGKSKEELLESVKDFDALRGAMPFAKASEDMSESTLRKLEALKNMKEGNDRELVDKSLSATIGNLPFSLDAKLGKSNLKKASKDENSRLTPSKIEELRFFMGKLKEGISRLEPAKKNINYRHRKDDVYNFTFNKIGRNRSLGGRLLDGDFSLEFDIDLNVKNCSAQINKFEFEIESFKFDSSFFELLDIVKVLDLVGMNLSYYLMTINGINAPELKPTKKAPKKKKFRANSKLERFIDDKRIIKTLNNNDIANYGQLKKFLEDNDLTTLKGVGKKTAGKIQEYIKL